MKSLGISPRLAVSAQRLGSAAVAGEGGSAGVGLVQSKQEEGAGGL